MTNGQGARSEMYPSALISVPTVSSGERQHVTQKPVDLLRALLSVMPDDPMLVLDPFMGSGTTALAAIKWQRKFIGIERSPEYVALSRRRIAQAISEGDVLSLEEKFLAGQGQNITPARYSSVPAENKMISARVKEELGKAAKLLQIEGYARIDAFVRIFNPTRVEVIFIEVNSLPGMTPATCIFHQAAIAHYRPYEFIDKILDYGMKKKKKIGVS
jgi:hypothetical protein